MANEFDPDAYLSKKREQSFDPDAYLASKRGAQQEQGPPERGVLERAGQAGAETFKAGQEAFSRTGKDVKPEDYLGPSGMLRSAKETGELLLSPLTMTVAPIAAGAESLISSGAAGAQRLLQKGIKAGTEYFSPGTKTAPVQSSEEAYEAARPGVSAAMTALMPGRGAPGRTLPYGPSRPPPPPGVAPKDLPPAEPREPGRRPGRGEEAEAGRIIEQLATDPAKVKRTLEAPPAENVPGSEPTTFQLIGDYGLGQAERGAKTRDYAPFHQREAQQNAARLKALEEAQVGGSAEDISARLRDIAQANEVREAEAVRLAQEQTTQTLDRMGGTNDPTTHGEVLRQELRNAEERVRTDERALWEVVDPGGRLRANPQPLQELERSIYGVMPEGGAAEASLTEVERRIAGVIQNYRNIIPFQELRDLRHLINTSLREELISSGQSPAYARLSRLRQGIADMEGRAFDEMGVLDADASQRLRTASTATRERAEQFGRGPVGQVLGREGSQGPFRVGEASVPEKFIQQGAKGYDSASSFLRASPGSLDVFQDAVAASARRAATDIDGVVNPRNLEGWLRRYQDTLRAIDERDGGAFSASLRDVRTAQQTLAAAEERLALTREANERGMLGQLIGSTGSEADITRRVGTLFGGVDRETRARQLRQMIAGNPAAEAGLRRSVIDYISERFIGTMEAGDTGKNYLRASMFQKFVRENESVLRQLLSPDQVRTLQAVAADLQQATRQLGTKMKGSSNTAQDLFNAARTPGMISKLSGSVMHHLLNKALGRFGGSTLYKVGEGYLARGREADFVRVQRMIDRALLEPDYAKELLGKAWVQRRRMGSALAGYELGTEEAERTQQERIPRQAGGGVPAIGGTGGRPPGARETARARAARRGAGQALQDGGEAREQQADPSYETKLSPGEEHVFQSWKQKYAPNDSGEDYDFRGAFKAGAKPDPRTKHWVDTFKKPNHPTFSDQSQYAKDRPDLAGSWQGKTYIPPQPRAEGGEVAAQPQLGSRERFAAALQGTPTGAGFGGGGGKQGKPQVPKTPSREDIRRTLQSFGIAGEQAAGFGERQLGEVDSRATGGSVDYETGERSPIHYDPGDDTTFDARFGKWDKTATGKSVPRDEEDIDTTIMAPGQKMIDPLGHRGTQSPTGPWFFTRGMQEGGEVEDRWARMPSSRNIEDRRAEEPLSAGQLIAGNQAFMGHYPSPYTRAPRKPATAQARQQGGGVGTLPDALIDHTRRYLADQIDGVEREHEKQDPLEALIEEQGGRRKRHPSDGASDEGRLQGGGIVRSVLRRLTPEARMLEVSRGEAPIRGLPQKPLDVGGEKFIPGPSADVREAARQYMQEKGLPYTPVQNYVPVDEPRARAIAKAYDVMPHRPTDPEVQRAYEALAKETRDQYELLNKRLGVKFEPLPPNVPDPYGATPRLAAKDFLENKHMYYFPTEQGFGSEASGIVSKEGQKMLEPSGVKIGGKEVPFNDLFRVVHDVFGHHKEGVGFRAAGEENAWRSHGRMYSPEALPAMTAETRGQNSWVNYGPEAAKNKGASAAETIYAPQKLGILPPWVIRSGRMTPLGVAGAAAALEERDRERDEQGFKFADGGEVNERPPLPDAVMDAWERGALRTKRGVLGAETTEGRGRPGEKFFEDPGQKEEAAKRIFETAVPQSPLEWGMLAATGPLRWPIKAGALALGATMQPSEAEAGKLGVAGKIGRKITGTDVPAAGRSVTRGHNMPPEELAPYPHYAEEYPAVGPPEMKPKTKPKYEGETYEAKQLTPEADAFAKERLRIQNEMDERGYQPYFDPAKRTHVDPSNYPAANVDTLTVQPKKPQTLMEYQDVIDMPATRELLQAAYARGLKLGDAKNWYAMAQLEKAYTNELGPKAGRKAFLDEFAVPMSAMTSGNDPETNFLLAQYAEYLRKQGKALPEEGHQLPVTVGGRRGAMNIRDYNAMRERGGYQGLGIDQPKMHNFTRNIIGDPSRATMDEQMATGMTKHIQDVDPKFPDRARRQAFGLLEKPVHEEAAAAGVPPANYQDVAWAGFKNEPGKPLISTINDAIERTHRLTGMPREEIVRRGLIRKEIPIYGLTAAATPYLWGGFRPQEGGSNNPTPAGQPPL